LAPLPYPYDALEPHIDTQTMRLHHDQHHQTYTDKFNLAVEELRAARIKANLDDAVNVLRVLHSLPISDALRGKLANFGGGYVNHNMFWEVMKPGGSNKPSDRVQAAIDQHFGSFNEFKKQFTQAAETQFGSGWAWLVYTPKDKNGPKLEILATPNQDTPLMQGKWPLLCLDVWEHAYYLKYQNRRSQYVTNWWNLVNWDIVAEYFAHAKSRDGNHDEL